MQGTASGRACELGRTRRVALLAQACLLAAVWCSSGVPGSGARPDACTWARPLLPCPQMMVMMPGGRPMMMPPQVSGQQAGITEGQGGCGGAVWSGTLLRLGCVCTKAPSTALRSTARPQQGHLCGLPSTFCAPPCLPCLPSDDDGTRRPADAGALGVPRVEGLEMGVQSEGALPDNGCLALTLLLLPCCSHFCRTAPPAVRSPACRAPPTRFACRR